MRPSPLLRPTLLLLASPASRPCFAASAPQAPPPVTLLRIEAGVQRDGLLRFHPATLAVQSLQEAAVPGGLLVLPDPDGAQLRYDYVSHSEHASGDLTWVGRAEGAALGQEAVVTVGPDAAFGRLPRPDGSVLQIDTVGGRTRLMVDDATAQGDSSEVQVDDARRPPVELLQAAAKSSTAAALRPGHDTGRPEPAGRDAGLQRRARHLRRQRRRRAHAAAEPHRHRQHRAGQRRRHRPLPPGGHAARGLHQRRQQRRRAGRDHLLAPRHGGADRAAAGHPAPSPRRRHRRPGAPLRQGRLVSCGNGWVGGYNGSNISGSIDFGYFTASHGTSDGSFCSERTIGHEIGHNLGQNHDITTNDNARDGAHTYSHGYRVTPAGQQRFLHRDGLPRRQPGACAHLLQPQRHPHRLLQPGLRRRGCRRGAQPQPHPARRGRLVPAGGRAGARHRQHPRPLRSDAVRAAGAHQRALAHRVHRQRPHLRHRPHRRRRRRHGEGQGHLGRAAGHAGHGAGRAPGGGIVAGRGGRHAQPAAVPPRLGAGRARAGRRRRHHGGGAGLEPHGRRKPAVRARAAARARGAHPGDRAGGRGSCTPRWSPTSPATYPQLGAGNARTQPVALDTGAGPEQADRRAHAGRRHARRASWSRCRDRTPARSPTRPPP